jgi:hypothetical protein
MSVRAGIIQAVITGFGIFLGGCGTDAGRDPAPDLKYTVASFLQSYLQTP